MNLAINMMTLNGKTAFIKETLDSVYDYSNEIIVYDTGSTDGTVEFVKDRFPKAIIKQFDIQHLGEIWTGSEKDRELTRLLNQMKKETKSEWILKIDDDELFPDVLMEEICDVIKNGGDNIVSIPFIHISKKTSQSGLIIKRLFRNTDAVSWSGIYGTETLALCGSRIRSHKCYTLSNHFYHLGELRKDNNRKHDYQF